MTADPPGSTPANISALASAMAASDALSALMREYPAEADPMAVLEAAVASLAFYDPDAKDPSIEAARRKAVRLTGQITTDGDTMVVSSGLRFLETTEGSGATAQSSRHAFTIAPCVPPQTLVLAHTRNNQTRRTARPHP